MYDYVGAVETLHGSFNNGNLTNLSETPAFLRDSFEDFTTLYAIVVIDTIVTDLGNTTQYYKNERCTMKFTVMHDDESSTRAQIEQNTREIIAEMARLMIADAISSSPEWEFAMNYSGVLSWIEPEVEFIMTREGVSIS